MEILREDVASPTQYLQAKWELGVMLHFTIFHQKLQYTKTVVVGQNHQFSDSACHIGVQKQSRISKVACKVHACLFVPLTIYRLYIPLPYDVITIRYCSRSTHAALVTPVCTPIKF